MTLSLADARRVIAAGERRARELGQPMNIAVVDGDGNLVSHVRMDGAWVGSVDVSINKAVTARAAGAHAVEARVRDLAAAGAPRFGGPDHTDNGYRHTNNGYQVDRRWSDGPRADRDTDGGYGGGGYGENGYGTGAGDSYPREGDRFGGEAGRGRISRPAGGVALVRGGLVVGAVGVSGGSADDDKAVAQAAATVL